MTRHRTVVITGGSAGVGRATARAFAAKGYAVAVIARGETRLRQTVEELRQGGARAFHAAADVADRDRGRAGGRRRSSRNSARSACG